MRSVIAVAMLLLASCAPQPAPIPSAQVETAQNVQHLPSGIGEISGEVKSWGATLRRWKVDGAGNVEHTSGEKVGANRDDIMIEVRRTRLSPAELASLRETVSRVKAVLAEPEQCDEMLTDGPYGTFRWYEGEKLMELPFSANCMKGRDYRLASAIFAADEIVDEAAKATQPVDRHPLAN